MKAPAFWYHAPGFLSTLLTPLGWMYDKGGKLLSQFKKPHSFPVPILSIGNIVSGGSGKTPTAIALALLLKTRGYKVHFVTRGYGGKERGPLKVDPLKHLAKNVGDEPLLLAEHAPTWMAKKRPQGVQKAIENGAQVIILDDGHQTTSLHKGVSLVVVDLLQGFGNGHVIPAGPLRENLSQGLERADGLIFVGEGEPLSPSSLRGTFNEDHVFHAHLASNPIQIPTKRVVAFCGLGFPEKFYRSLENEGFELIATQSFPDHYQYTEEDFLRLKKLAQHYQCALITTRKDVIKMLPSWQKQLYVLDVTIKFEDSEKICDFILERIYG